MTDHTISSLRFVPRESLASMILSPDSHAPPGIAIIDVRDSDHVGGHIANSLHVPLPSLEAQMPTLLRKCEDKEVVIFHCALSQQRGPSAALKYLRAKSEKALKENKSEDGSRRDGSPVEGEDASANAKVSPKEQEVLVLDGGFVKWQEKYGQDPRLTEEFVPDVWEGRES